ncbi:MAG TPA: thioredoxin domain-containing protein [Gemmataceae bacterium]|nr:thioredoxin domain-containing protein [Gemmataceae bacterium]
MTAQAKFTNRLSHETSPYLRQHAHNPVDWYPWGPEALERARQLDRPIFLSIGYSACHWCHVMEHESFENEEIAKILNDNFISIKVDREERPDLDQIYMASVQMLTGSGGWPMSVFLTPDLQPFTGGTYFPPDDRYGRPGFKRLLLHIVEVWTTRRADVNEAASQITGHLQDLGRLDTEEGELDASLLRQAASGLSRSFDARNGGFGQAPKFLHSMDLRLLLRCWRRFDDPHALEMVRVTLDHMAMGGIYDHLGGGFARYSTDERWLVPHFEKMLYDNALLVPCYLETFQATGEPIYRETAEETLSWVLREMTSPDGPFYSTLDADSEGEEGKFYVWSAVEIEQILGKDDVELFNAVYGVEPEGNWEHGHNILHRVKTFAQYARLNGLSETDLRGRLDRCRRNLFEVRGKRIWPGRDEKTLTSWNGLMIGALAQAAQVLDRADYADAAARAADFILTRMRTPDGRLLRTWSAGSEPKLNAYLEDYSFLLDGLVSLYEATFAPRWIEAALDLAEMMIDQFWDTADGGFFYTGRNHEALIARGKDPHDNAIPSGNAMAVTALLRLVKLTGRMDLQEKAETTLRLYRGLLGSHPLAAGQMLLALDFHLGPVQEIAIVGDPSAEDTRRVLRIIRGAFQPHRVVALKPPTSPQRQQGTDKTREELLPLLADKTSQGVVTVYVCQNFTCQAPLIGVEAIEAALSGPKE